jgi:hypothetical protein
MQDNQSKTESPAAVSSTPLVRRKPSYRRLVAKELGTDDICVLLAWQRMAIRLGELWNAHIRLAKENGDIGFIREQEAVSELRLLCATLPPNGPAQRPPAKDV